jgi:hypothetical protein
MEGNSLGLAFLKYGQSPIYAGNVTYTGNDGNWTYFPEYLHVTRGRCIS